MSAAEDEASPSRLSRSSPEIVTVAEQLSLTFLAEIETEPIGKSPEVPAGLFTLIEPPVPQEPKFAGKKVAVTQLLSTPENTASPAATVRPASLARTITPAEPVAPGAKVIAL